MSELKITVKSNGSEIIYQEPYKETGYPRFLSEDKYQSTDKSIRAFEFISHLCGEVIRLNVAKEGEA